ncbi:MAG: hypothetical protein ACOC2H_09020, partial [Spirochaetota bacterium]
RIAAIPSFLRSCLLFNPYFDCRKCDSMVFDHSRKMKIESSFIDIHTHYLIQSLRGKESVTVYEEPFQNRHLTRAEPGRKHMDFIQILSNVIPHVMPVFLNKSEKTLLGNVRCELNETLGIDLDLIPYVTHQIRKFKVLYGLLSILYSIKKPKRIFVLVGYGHPAHIAAAKKKGIETIEIQHGIISVYHPGYHYPHVPKGSLEYFPDRICLWDTFWRSACSYPLPNEALTVTGFEYMNRMVQKYRNITPDGKTILVVSQGALGNEMAKVIYDNRNDLGDYTILYKLHPGEYDRWRDYEHLKLLDSTCSNVTIIDNNDTPLYHMLASAAFVIGVYSTVLYEALNFRCKIILLDLPGIEFTRHLSDRTKAVILPAGKRLRSVL